jgi:hypothetical protein
MFALFSRINEGTLDRALRIVIGLALVFLTFLGPKSAWGYLGIIPLVTGLMGFCPMYRVLGITTCPMRPTR